MKLRIYLLLSHIYRNPIFAFGFVLIGTSLSIFFFWGMAISGDLVFQALKGRSDAQTRLILVGATSLAGGVAAAVLWRSQSDHEGRSNICTWMRHVVTAFATIACVAVLLALLSEWEKLGAALQDTMHNFWRFAFWPTLISFSLLWTGRVITHDLAKLFVCSRQLTVVLNSARGLIGASICAATASWIAVRHGAELNDLHAPRAFYIAVVPAVAGFGWTAAWTTAPSRLFLAALLLFALSMAVFTVMRPSSRDNRIECQYWYPTGVHNVFGFRTNFRYEPWRWRLENAFDLLFVPGAIGELTVSYIREPLTVQRC